MSSHKLKIAIIANNIDHGLTYQRAHLILRHLKEYEFVPINTQDLCPSKLLYCDAAIMLHPYSPLQATIAKRFKSQYGIPLIVDIDDLLDNLPSDHTEYGAFKSNQAHVCAMFADALTVSTESLRLKWGTLNKNTVVIPNVVDMSRYEGLMDIPKPYRSGYTIGWTGSQSHRPDLYNTGFIEGLAEVMRNNDNVRAHFHNLCPQVLLDEFGSRIIYTNETVDFLDYPALVSTFGWDLVAVPLYNHPFNDAKSDLKLLEFAPFKTPVIASNRASYSDLSDKFLYTVKSDTALAWKEGLEHVIANQSQALERAQRAFDYVRHERTILQGAYLWRGLLEQVLRRFPRKGL